MTVQNLPLHIIMRPLFLSILISLSFVSCYNADKKFFTEINATTYKKYKTVDTLYKTKDYTATKCEDTISYFKVYVTLFKMSNGKYFVLDPDACLENDSTIICYSPPLKSDSENGSFQEDGIWFYAHFYTEKTDSTGIIQESVGEVKYSVDSMPTHGELIVRPKSEGVYLYQNNILKKVLAEQSEDKFYSLQKDGFYFLPNSGRFFEKYNIKILE